MWHMLVTIAGIVLLILIFAFCAILFLALKHHYGWWNKDEKEEYKHWKQKYHLTKEDI